MATARTWLILCIITMLFNVSLAERVLKEKETVNHVEKQTKGFLKAMVDFLWESGKSSYEPVWPVSLSFVFSLLISFCIVYFTCIHYILCRKWNLIGKS